MPRKKEANTSKTKKSTARTGKRKPKSPAPKAEGAVKSPAFQQAKSKAEEYARDPEKAKKLVDEAMKKAKGKNKGPLSKVWRYLSAFSRLIRAYYNRQYTDIPWTSIVWVLAALIYFIFPIDFIPDFIPVLGLTDDVAVIVFVVNKITADLDNFLAWEISQQAKES